jgi:hypothetical protein
MAVVMNMRGHAVPLTTGLLAARQTRNVDTTLPLEQMLLGDGTLAIVDTTAAPVAPAPAGDWRPTVQTVGDLPQTGNTDGDVRLVRGEGIPYVWQAAGGQWAPLVIAGDGAGGDTAVTVDTNQLFRRIVFADGTDKWIPFSAQPPATPAAPAVAIRLSSVKLTWPAASGASSYAIFRDGSRIATTSSRVYRDINVTAGSTYSYRVQAADSYGQPSPLSPVTAAFVDPAINAAPTADIRVWPTTVPTGGTAIVRVNSFDVDVHTLAFQLDADAGQLAPTDDPSVWTLSST